MINLTKNVTVVIPTIPNNITIEGMQLDISNFDETELLRIGHAWTQKLIATAKERKEEYNKKPKTKLTKKKKK